MSELGMTPIDIQLHVLAFASTAAGPCMQGVRCLTLLGMSHPTSSPALPRVQLAAAGVAVVLSLYALR